MERLCERPASHPLPAGLCLCSWHSLATGPPSEGWNSGQTPVDLSGPLSQGAGGLKSGERGGLSQAELDYLQVLEQSRGSVGAGARHPLYPWAGQVSASSGEKDGHHLAPSKIANGSETSS